MYALLNTYTRVLGKFLLRKFHLGKFHRENCSYGKFLLRCFGATLFRSWLASLAVGLRTLVSQVRAQRHARIACYIVFFPQEEFSIGEIFQVELSQVEFSQEEFTGHDMFSQSNSMSAAQPDVKHANHVKSFINLHNISTILLYSIHYTII